MQPLMLALPHPPSYCAFRIPCRFPSCRSEHQAPSRHSHPPVNKVTCHRSSGESVSCVSVEEACLFFCPRCFSLRISCWHPSLTSFESPRVSLDTGPRCQRFFLLGILHRVIGHHYVPTCAGATGKQGLNCTHPEHKA